LFADLGILGVVIAMVKKVEPLIKGMRPIMVEWVDSSYSNGWHNIEDLDNYVPTKVVSFGLLAKDAKDFIIILLNYGKTQFSNSMTIPKCSIKQMWRLKVK